MAKNLVIVESPAKAKTITKFLGPGFKVLASMGHVRDLPKSEMGIDIENGTFMPTYEVTETKRKVVKQLRAELKNASNLWIATDEDREGEAIGWHLLSALGVDQKKMPIKRIVFHEITKDAIQNAVKNPREINKNVVDAQQARRVLDRLVGYELSPLLWKKIRYGLSAGRVQSVAVRLIVDREREIEAFQPEEYWKVIATLEKDGKEKKSTRTFQAELQKFKGKKYKVTNEKQVKGILADIEGADYKVVKVVEKQTKRNPAPPFITSTLQQEASRKLGFSVKKTMMVAQQLYEGVDIGGENKAFITYMRTDSVNLSNTALNAAKEVIEKEFGKEFSLAKPRRYKGKKGAQEAHEAIRPVDMTMTPQMAVKHLNKDQARLYELIWKRTIACQMKQALLDRVAVDIEPWKNGSSTEYQFRATGQTVKFAGFMKVYMEGHDDDEEENEKNSLGEKFLPNLSEEEMLALEKMDTNQHFTKPPARYTEASLVKKLEAEGIGRPSTYAPTISTVMNRGYVEKDGKVLIPTDLAMLVTDMLVEHFSKIVDYKFTAGMEEKLDLVEEGELQWVPMVKEFYGPFHKKIEEKEGVLDKSKILKERILGKDEKSNLEVVVRHGRFGPYVQLGNFTKEEIEEMTDKPRRASLPKGTYFESITMEEALKALELPRTLGKDKETKEDIVVTTGRFGPYMKIGKLNVSLGKDLDPYTVTLGDVEGIIKEAREIKKKQMTPLKEFKKKDPVSKELIAVRVGRYGPYVTDGKTNASISKKIDPEKLTYSEAVELLAKKRKAKSTRRKKA